MAFVSLQHRQFSNVPKTTLRSARVQTEQNLHVAPKERRLIKWLAVEMELKVKMVTARGSLPMHPSSSALLTMPSVSTGLSASNKNLGRLPQCVRTRIYCPPKGIHA